jgi:hypothetical protein
MLLDGCGCRNCRSLTILLEKGFPGWGKIDWKSRCALNNSGLEPKFSRENSLALKPKSTNLRKQPNALIGWLDFAARKLLLQELWRYA